MANDEHVAMLKTARPANARGELIRSRTVRSWRPRIRLCGRFGDRPGVHVACRRTHDRLDTDIAAGTRPVLDDEWLTEPF
jgi:hypothetical protein